MKRKRLWCDSTEFMRQKRVEREQSRMGQLDYLRNSRKPADHVDRVLCGGVQAVLRHTALATDVGYSRYCYQFLDWYSQPDAHLSAVALRLGLSECERLERIYRQDLLFAIECVVLLCRVPKILAAHGGLYEVYAGKVGLLRNAMERVARRRRWMLALRARSLSGQVLSVIVAMAEWTLSM